MRQPPSTSRSGPWVDPRTDPRPGPSLPPERSTANAEDVAELVDLCRAGRIYSVERWIRSGRPLQARYEDEYPFEGSATPLSVAIRTGQFDLAVLLLCNGYRPELEPRSVLDLVLERRAWEWADLFLEWGAYPLRVSPEAVLDTYRREMMDRFWDLGLDFTRNHCLASYLEASARNKPAYGFARRHRDDPRVAYDLTLALGEAVWDDKEKAVSLLVWAGADPHRKVPSLRWGSGDEDDPDEDRSSAVEMAIHLGRGQLLRHLKPDPELDDFDELYPSAHDLITLRALTALQPPTDWSTTIVRNISRWSYPWGTSGAREVLRHIFEDQCGRLSTLDVERCRDLRRNMLKLDDHDLDWLLRKLGRSDHCDREIFLELIRTPSMRRRMVALGLEAESPSRPPRTGRRRGGAGV